MTMLRVLITQKNEDGSIKTKNGKQQLGGVIYDRMGDALGYVFEERKYVVLPSSILSTSF